MKRGDWPAYVAMLFLIGAGVGLVRLSPGWRRCDLTGCVPDRSPIQSCSKRPTCCWRNCEARRRVALRESELLATPATIGWRRPLDYPAGRLEKLDRDECRAVLAHEIAHIARHDLPTWVAAQLALVFHFYHPLVHWLAARLRLEQELAADAAAAQLRRTAHI